MAIRARRTSTRPPRLAPLASPALALFLLSIAAPRSSLQAQRRDANVVYDPALYGGMEFRGIGPTRGGRVTAVEGVRLEPRTFYMGAAGGGVWKTTNGGESWENVSDGFFEVASIGAIEVADSDPNVVYVGTGSACIRGNVSTGRGVYRSRDAGKTWTFVGLREAGQIGDVEVHPRDPDLVYVAALGHPFGPNEERGVFRSRDGGETWERVLFVSDSTGFVDLAVNPENPREIYAAAWRAERKPWTLTSGATEGGIWKSADGGDSWEKLEGGLPTGLVGKIGVTVSPARPERVWAIIEASDFQGASTGPTTRGRAGVGSAQTPPSSGGPGTTPTSTPTRRTRTPCTSTPGALRSRWTGAAAGKRSTRPTRTTTTCG